MKIIKSLSVIAIVAAIAVGATTAYFSDEEKSVGNTFTAGTIDIAIDGQNPWTNHYDIGDLKPGETGYINFNIQNVGENPVNVSKNLSDFVGTGGNETFDCTGLNPAGTNKTSSEPECVAERANSNTRKDDVQTQILYDLSVKVYAQGNDTTPIWWQTIYTGAAGETLLSIYPDANHYVALGMIPFGGHMKVTQSYHFSKDADNKYQGDRLSFNITIRGEQLPQGEEGMAMVTLENKTKTGNDWIINQNDTINGVLTYSTKGPEFVYNFTGKAPLTGHGYVLAIGKKAHGAGFDVDTEIATGSTDGNGDIHLTGSIDIGKDMTDVKVWLVPTENWTSGAMDWAGWDACVSNFLWETSLISYDDTNN